MNKIIRFLYNITIVKVDKKIKDMVNKFDSSDNPILGLIVFFMLFGAPVALVIGFIAMSTLSELLNVNINDFGFDNIAWLGFWGSYISNIITIIVLYITTKQNLDMQKENEKENKSIQEKLDKQYDLQLRLSYEPMLSFKKQDNGFYEIGSNTQLLDIGNLINTGRGNALNIKASICKNNETIDTYSIALLSLNQTDKIEFNIYNKIDQCVDAYDIVLEYEDMLGYKYRTTFISVCGFQQHTIKHERL